MKKTTAMETARQRLGTVANQANVCMPGVPRHLFGEGSGPPTASIDGAVVQNPDELAHRWLTLLDTHLTRPPGQAVSPQQPLVRLPDWKNFRASLRNGFVGDLQYCHMLAAPHVYVNDRLQHPSQPHHMVVLQLSGTSTFVGDGGTARVRPGDFLLLHGTRHIRVEHETQIEQLALHNPLAPEDAMQFGLHSMQFRAASGALGRLTFRWLRDACLTPELNASGASMEVKPLLTRLLLQVFGNTDDPSRETNARLTRQSIEDYIRQRIKDSELNPAHIAAAFGCSVRTLHRTFGGSASGSLERFLWQARIEACTQALRNPQEAKTTLLEIALRHGFTSPAHFSALFRRMHGMTPSEYRRRCLEI